MKKTFPIISLLYLGLLSCSNGNEFEPQDFSPVVCEEIVIGGVCEDRWTYFSFEKGVVVGQSDFNDREQDSIWFSTPDWDIAFCGDKIRTNGGASGAGLARLQMNMSDSYESIVIAPDSGYFEDAMSDY